MTQTITVAELASRIHRPRDFVIGMLAGWRDAGIVEEHAGGWCLTAVAARRFRGLTAEIAPDPTATPALRRPVREAPQPKLSFARRCGCGCGAPLGREHSGRRRLPGHETRRLAPRERLRQEQLAAADTKPITSRCARCGATFGPGPVSRVGVEFRKHACEVAA